MLSMRKNLLAALGSFFVLVASSQQKTYDFSQNNPEKININVLEKKYRNLRIRFQKIHSWIL
jgi:hypothetical protein